MGRFFGTARFYSYGTVATITLKSTGETIVGYVATRPMMDAVKIVTTPHYPILNCPIYFTDDSCGEVLYINKADIYNIADIDD
ncbi:hypothetical protein ACFBZI_11180 [Moraxella sp. ZJ142]|uniref:hypothetical protein n=1 Tax=Moraxella marmotae TaxID=3344520 RepID=UPI0035D493F4